MLQGQSTCEGTLPDKLGQFSIFDWLEFTIFYDLGTYSTYYDLDKKKSYISDVEVDYLNSIKKLEKKLPSKKGKKDE